MKKRDKANYLIQSVSHAFDVLEELARAGGEVGVTELSKRLRLHKNNVFRLLATLELRGYAEQNPESEDYRLGIRALELGQSYAQSNSLISRSLSVLQRLSESTGETVSLVTMSNGFVQYPLSIESRKPVRVSARPGLCVAAKTTAAGRLLTAHLSDAALAEVLSGNEPQDAAIRSQLHELRTNGQVIDRGVTEPEVVSISRIIRGLGGEVIGAIEMLVPQFRAKIDILGPRIEEAAKTLSTVLGGMARRGLAASVEKQVEGGATSAPTAGVSTASLQATK